MPKNGKAVILVSCGTSIATSTMVEEILREDLVRKRKYNIDFHHCKTSELAAKIEMVTPDVVITTATVPKEWIANWEESGIHYFKGTPFLTGVGVEPIMEKLLELLDKWQVKKK